MRLRPDPLHASGWQTSLRFRAALALAAVSVGAPLWGAEPIIRSESTIATFASRPISFEANRGQADAALQFIARGPAYCFSIAPTQAYVSLRKSVQASATERSSRGRVRVGDSNSYKSVRLEFLGANPQAEISGEDEMSGRVNYFIGREVANWRTGVPLFARVRVAEMYPGISLLYYGNQQQLEYDFEVAPDADPSAIAIRFSGADHLTVNQQGDLTLQLGEDEIRQLKPLIYQQVGDRRKEIAGGFALSDPQTVKFVVGDYDRRLPLVIDPVLSYSTYYGGSGLDAAWGVAVDASGFVYVAGESMAGLPTTAGTATNHYGGAGTGLHGDAFVAKFDPSFSNVLYLAYIGGGYDDVALSVAVDAAGSAYVTGYTDSPDFPVANALFDTISGTPYPFIDFYPTDAFVTKLGPSGTNLIYSTYLGGNLVDVGFGIAIDPAGNTYVAGSTESTNFPTANVTGSFTNYSGGYQINDDAFVTKIGSAGTNLIYSMFLGGTNFEWAMDIAANAAGMAYVTGWTFSTNFPVTANAYQPRLAGKADAFVTVVSPSGSTLITSTYLGGSGINKGEHLALDAESNFYITGSTTADPSFPLTPNALNGGGIFRSDNGATDWNASSDGLASVTIKALAIDSITPSRMYAGTQRGVARSVDGGATWRTDIGVSVPTNIVTPYIALGEVAALATDPASPSTIYAGTSGQGVYHSDDFGDNWSLSSTDLLNQSVFALAVAPLHPARLYAGTFGSGIFVSTNGATNWSAINNGLGNINVNDLAVHPTSPATLYAATDGGVYRTTNSGASWLALNSGLADLTSSAIVVDPVTPATLYVATDDGIFKSLNAGTNWSQSNMGLTLTNRSLTSLNIDPLAPTTLYAGTTRGVFKSSDAGGSWNVYTNGLAISSVLSIAINPQSPAKLYAGLSGISSFGGEDVFLFKSGSDGYSVVFGGAGDDEGLGVAVDPAGRAHIVGSTASTNFPTRNTSGFLSATNSGSRDAFVTELSQDGRALRYSAYLGGAAAESGTGLALDGGGNVYLVGETASANFPTTSGALQRTYGGGKSDAFIARIANTVLNPVLGIQPLSGQVRLFWTALAADYLLQSNTNLLTSNSWVKVLNPPVETNAMLSVSLPTTNAAQFFRLSNP